MKYTILCFIFILLMMLSFNFLNSSMAEDKSVLDRNICTGQWELMYTYSDGWQVKKDNKIIQVATYAEYIVCGQKMEKLPSALEGSKANIECVEYPSGLIKVNKIFIYCE